VKGSYVQRIVARIATAVSIAAGLGLLPSFASVALAHHPELSVVGQSCVGTGTDVSLSINVVAWVGHGQPSPANDLSRQNTNIQVRMSVNGGAFTTIGSGAFTPPTYSFPATAVAPAGSSVVVEAKAMVPWANGAGGGESFQASHSIPAALCATPTPTPSPTPTASATPSPTPSATPSPSPSATPSPTGTPAPSATPSPTQPPSSGVIAGPPVTIDEGTSDEDEPAPAPNPAPTPAPTPAPNTFLAGAPPVGSTLTSSAAPAPAAASPRGAPTSDASPPAEVPSLVQDDAFPGPGSSDAPPAPQQAVQITPPNSGAGNLAEEVAARTVAWLPAALIALTIAASFGARRLTERTTARPFLRR
jgi:hypothetical protein